jgi:hypothetical protein
LVTMHSGNVSGLIVPAAIGDRPSGMVMIS